MPRRGVLAAMSLALPWLGLSPCGDLRGGAKESSGFRRDRRGDARVGRRWPAAAAADAAARMVPHAADGSPFFAVLLGIAGSAAFFAIAIAVETLAHLSEAVTIDRDGGAAASACGTFDRARPAHRPARRRHCRTARARLLTAIAASSRSLRSALVGCRACGSGVALWIRRAPASWMGSMAILYLGAAGWATWLLL